MYPYLMDTYRNRTESVHRPCFLPFPRHCDCVTQCFSLHSDNGCTKMDVSLETHQE